MGRCGQWLDGRPSASDAEAVIVTDRTMSRALALLMQSVVKWPITAVPSTVAADSFECIELLWQLACRLTLPLSTARRTSTIGPSKLHSVTITGSLSLTQVR